MAFEKERVVAESVGVSVARRHIFLCCDQTKPKCCDKERGLAAWDYLKTRLKELGLSELGGVLRTKANCLRICEGGPDSGPIGRLSQAERFHWLVAPRSTVIQVTPAHTGLCDDPDKALDHLFDTLVRAP